MSLRNRNAISLIKDLDLPLLPYKTLPSVTTKVPLCTEGTLNALSAISLFTKTFIYTIFFFTKLYISNGEKGLCLLYLSGCFTDTKTNQMKVNKHKMGSITDITSMKRRKRTGCSYSSQHLLDELHYLLVTI